MLFPASDTGTGSRSRSHAVHELVFLAARRSEHGLTGRDLGDEQHVLGLGDFSGSVPTHGAPHEAPLLTEGFGRAERLQKVSCVVPTAQ